MCFSSPSVILTSPNSTVETTGAWSTRTPSSPSAILATTRSASPSKIISSGVMILQKSCRPSATLAYLPGLADLPRGGRLLVLPGLPGLLGLLVVPTLDDFLERADRVFQLDELALEAGELLGDEERLREEALDPARPTHDDLVLLGEFVDAEDGDDVLEFLVALQDVLDLLGDLVVLIADDRRVEDRGG